MKVACLLGSLNRGGTETLVLDVFRNADSVPFEMIGIHRKDGALKEAFYECGKPFYQLTPRFPYDPMYLLKLRRVLLKEKVNVVHAQQIIDACYAYWALRGTSIKLVYSIHGFYDGVDKRTDKRIQWISDKVDKTIFVSEYQRQHYVDGLSLDRAKTGVVYNGISFDKLILPQKKSPVATLGKPLKFGMVGNFVRGREQNSVVKFLKLLREEGVAFDFYFVGKRDEKEAWRYDDCVRYCRENGLTDCVHFLGSRNDVPQLLSEWDAFVYSTDHDTFGIAVIEAIASGLPTFVNDYAVMREVTQNGKWASLYKTKDPQDLLKQFLQFMKERTAYCEKALQDAAEVRKAYSIEKHIKNLHRCYTAL